MPKLRTTDGSARREVDLHERSVSEVFDEERKVAVGRGAKKCRFMITNVIIVNEKLRKFAGLQIVYKLKDVLAAAISFFSWRLVLKAGIYTLMLIPLWTTNLSVSRVANITYQKLKEEVCRSVHMAEETAVSGYKRFEKAIKKASEETGIPYHVIDAVIEMESQGKPKARSPKGAVGLMQLMPRTAKLLGVNPHNPDENIAGGARYLADMLTQFGTMEKALAAYNAGPVAVRKGKIPRQTRRYVGNVLNLSRAMAPWEVGTEEEPALGPTLRRMVR